MRLSAKILENVSSINHWNYANEAYVYEGQANTIYLQLVDLSKPIQASSEFPMRYSPTSATFSLSAKFSSVDSAKEFTIVATKPFADDKSIFKIDIPSTQFPRTGNLILILTENGTSKTFLVKSAIVAELLNVGGC
ncbi:MAG TPA: hypothetical protein VI911_11895 [Patescibacteria group bacterium]|nr:hypothetical protein [Patescibacteria group bacterium]